MNFLAPTNANKTCFFFWLLGFTAEKTTQIIGARKIFLRWAVLQVKQAEG